MDIPALPVALLSRYRSLLWVVNLIIGVLTSHCIEALPDRPGQHPIPLPVFILVYAQAAAHLTRVAPTSPLALALNALVAAGLELSTDLPESFPATSLRSIQACNPLVADHLNDTDPARSARPARGSPPAAASGCPPPRCSHR